mgnify:CR=1 FL=1
MGSVTLTIPDNEDQRVLDAFCNSFGYNASVDGTQGQFLKKKLITYVKQVVSDYERQAAFANASESLTVVNPT